MKSGDSEKKFLHVLSNRRKLNFLLSVTLFNQLKANLEMHHQQLFFNSVV